MSDAVSGRRAVGAYRPSCSTLAVLRALANRWDRQGIDYAVANGLDGYPSRLGRDIDVVVARRHLHEASEILRSTLQHHGKQDIVRSRRELVQHIGISSDGDAIVVDLFPGLRWGPVWLVQQPQASLKVGPFAVDPWASFVKRILLHILVAPTRKFASAIERLNVTDAEARAARRCLSSLAGKRLADRTLVAIKTRDLAALERLRPRLRRTLIVRAFLRQPLHALGASGQWLDARMSLAFCAAAMPTLSVVGPDGVGKSTLIGEVARLARGRLRCSKIVLRHWRPGLLPQLGKFAGKPTPAGGAPPRRMAGRFGLLRLLYYWVDFMVGGRLRDRPVSRDLGLVIYDRGALDMWVDPLRYGLPPRPWTRHLLRFLPRQDLVVLLHDDPARIRQRKAELEEAEIRRQLNAWQELTVAGEVDMILSVNAPPATLAGEVVNKLVNLLVARHANGN